MKIFSKLKNVFKRSRAEWDDFWFTRVLPGVWAGNDVNEESALQMSAVYACIRILSDTVAHLPLKLYRRQGDGREEVTGTRLTDLFKFAPNPEMSAFRWKQVSMGHLCAWGNSYNYVSRDAANRVVDLWPLRPDKMEVKRDQASGELKYVYRKTDGIQEVLTTRDVWHIPGFGFDGVLGYSPIMLARQGIGLGLAAEEYAARFFGNGANVGLIVKTQKKMGADSQARLQKSLAQGYSGLGKAHKLMVLEEGMDVEKIGIDPEAAALIAQRNFSVTDICRWYRIPPHMVAQLDRATFSNITEEGINFARHTITPWVALIEGEMNRYFFTPAERKTKYWEFDLNGLMRGDFKSRMEGYVQAVSNGIMTRNEVRQLENLNAVSGKGGNILTVQLAMTNLDDVADPPEPKPIPMLPQQEPPEDDDEEKQKQDELENKSWAARWMLENKKIMLEDTRTSKIRAAATRDRVAEQFKPLIKIAATEIINKEARAVAKAVTRNIDLKQTRSLFTDWLNDFYNGLPEYIRSKLAPVFEAFTESVHAAAAAEIGYEPDMTPELRQWVVNYTERYIKRHIDSSMGQIMSLAEESMESVEQRMHEWQEKRPDKISTNESVRMAQGVALTTWFSVGFGATWAIRGPSTCPYCKALDGRTIRDGDAFVHDGTSWEPSGANNGPMKINGMKQHPPLHQGCDCLIIPG